MKENDARCHSVDHICSLRFFVYACLVCLLTVLLIYWAQARTSYLLQLWIKKKTIQNILSIIVWKSIPFCDLRQASPFTLCIYWLCCCTQTNSWTHTRPQISHKKKKKKKTSNVELEHGPVVIDIVPITHCYFQFGVLCVYCVIVSVRETTISTTEVRV